MKSLLTLLAPLKQATPAIASIASLHGYVFALAAGSLFAMNAPAQAAPRNLGKTVAMAQAPTLPDGVYLYGQSAQPEQIGKGYFVFESRRGKLIGALYMPRSSFDCTYGTLEPDKVSLKVIDTYDKSENPYIIGTERVSEVASRENPTVGPISLEGFHRINTVSANDRRILNVCKANYQQRAWK